MLKIGCAACGCALEGPADGSLEDRYSCPRCGAGDTKRAIMLEIGSAGMKQALGEKFPNETIAKGTGISVTLKVPGSRKSRFIAMQ